MRVSTTKVTQTACPYMHISQAEANLLDFSFVPTAEAQPSVNQKSATINSTGMQDAAAQINSQLTMPFYLVILAFFAFVILMSFVYIYHWTKFNMQDSFVKSFITIYLVGLFILSIPLIFNLL